MRTKPNKYFFKRYAISTLPKRILMLYVKWLWDERERLLSENYKLAEQNRELIRRAIESKY